jgi:hypothetical protein
MSRKLPSLIVAGWVAFSAILGHAQSESVSPADNRTLEIVDRLKEIIQRNERKENPDRELTNKLKDLVRRYDWPWRVRLFVDDFSDGDYTKNPAWTVNRGEFHVVLGSGLRSIVEVPSPFAASLSNKRGETTALDLFSGFRKSVSGPAASALRFRDPPWPAEISATIAMDNTFAIRVRMASGDKNAKGSRVEFGPYRGSDRNWGYRLAYNPGQIPAFEIVRLSPGHWSLVQSLEAPMSLEDGKFHSLDWRRDRDGNILVLLDEQELLRAVDRDTAEFFDGFAIVNGGGDFTFERIEIFGTER